MFDLVASLIKDGGWDSYRQMLLLRYVFLRKALSKLEQRGESIAGYIESNLAPLAALNAESLVSEGTPFLWMNVLRCHQDARKGGDKVEAISRHIVMLAFDSYFDHLQDGVAVTLPAIEGADIILPCLGISIPAKGCKAVLRRLGATEMEAEVDDKRLRIDLRDTELQYRLTRFDVCAQEKVSLIVAKDPAIFQEDYFDAISLDVSQAETLAAKVGRSIEMIGEVDPNLRQELNALIKWYVPIITPDPNVTHNSFTVKTMLGVMFASGSYHFLPLLEAIVHEYHHAELFMLMATKDVLGPDSDRLFYSPWREDARPLYGLFHALHVFTAVADFYSRAYTAACFDEFKSYISSRQAEVSYRIMLGLAQVPRDQLPPVGRDIYDLMKEEFNLNEEKIHALDAGIPSSISSHMIKWSEKYPELASSVRIPNELRRPANHYGADPKGDSVPNLRDFVTLWDHPDADKGDIKVFLRTTPLGQVHSTATTSAGNISALPKWHPLFEGSLERGIRDLVLLLVGKYNWISYTSCEGHNYDKENISLAVVERYVGLIARSDVEHKLMNAVLRETRDQINSRYDPAPIDIEIINHFVESNDKHYPSTKVVFRCKMPHKWEDYFMLLDGVYAAAVQELHNKAPHTEVFLGGTPSTLDPCLVVRSSPVDNT